MREKIRACIYFCIIALASLQVEAKIKSDIQAASSGNLSKQQVDLLVQRYAGRPHKNFRDFCLSIYSSSSLTLTPEQRAALGQFASKQQLSGWQREVEI